MYNNHLGTIASNAFYNIPHNEGIFSSDYPVNVCSSCGYGFYTKDISPEQLDQYYREEYSNWNLNHIASEKEFDQRSIGQFRFVEDHVSFRNSDQMLEIGAGAALPSRYIKSKFPNLSSYVIEPNPNFINYYQSKGLIRISGNFPCSKVEKGSFDYVHASHWLEHVIQLHDTVYALRTIIKPNGYLFLEVPNCTDEYYSHDIKDTPHLHFFTQKSLELLLHHFGFKLIKAGTYWLTFREYYLFTQGKVSTDTKTQATIQSASNVLRPRGAWLRLLFKKTANET